jgi:hypothetical protein
MSANFRTDATLAQGAAENGIETRRPRRIKSCPLKKRAAATKPEAIGLSFVGL